MKKEENKKLMQPRFAVLINCIWLIIWISIIVRLNGIYPGDYLFWAAAVTIAGLFIPWCFTDLSETE